MSTIMSSRDTMSLGGAALPAVLNEDAFWPFEPKTLEECGLSEMIVESIVLQIFLAIGTLTGRNMSERIRLPYNIIEQQLVQLRMRQLITHARPAPLNDFYYSLTENGQKRAVSYQKTMSYTGPAPVPLVDYVLSVEAQAGNFEPVTEPQLKAALSEVTYEPSWLDFLGPAVNSNSGIFLYGPPGNGKTTLAKCLAACRGQEIWIPHAIIDDGMIIKLFDSSYHIPSSSKAASGGILADQEHDRRWIRVRRPTVIVGGELTLDSLEIRHDPRSNTCEAPLQVKSNCGCLLIDDFGRQRIAPAELLNRWIVPLESRHDFLSLPTGKKISVPFEQIILFSTNLQPEELVDEAFMRRVPFKIQIDDPSPAEFVDLFHRACDSMDIVWRPEVIDRLIDKHYRAVGRPLRRCHARDLLHQITCLCSYRSERPELRNEFIDLACRNYFSANVSFANKKTSSGETVGWQMHHVSVGNPLLNRGREPQSISAQQNSLTDMVAIQPQVPLTDRTYAIPAVGQATNTSPMVPLQNALPPITSPMSEPRSTLTRTVPTRVNRPSEPLPTSQPLSQMNGRPPSQPLSRPSVPSSGRPVGPAQGQQPRTESNMGASRPGMTSTLPPSDNSKEMPSP